MFIEPCSQAELDAWAESERPGYVPSQITQSHHSVPAGVKSEPASPTRVPFPSPSFRVKDELDSMWSSSPTLADSSYTRFTEPDCAAPLWEEDTSLLASLMDICTENTPSSCVKSEPESDDDSEDEIEIIAVRQAVCKPANRTLKLEPASRPRVVCSTKGESDLASDSESGSESDTDDEVEVVAVSFKPPVVGKHFGYARPNIKLPLPAPVPHGQAKRKRSSSPGCDSDSDDDGVFKKPAVPPCKKLRPASPPPPSNPHLSQFFASYPNFKYDPSRAVSQQFKELRKVYEWRRGDVDGNEAYHKYSSAVVKDFIEHYGFDAEDLGNWQKLCTTVGIVPLPTSLEGCRRAIEDAHVNLMDCVDIHNTGQAVRRFGTEKELADYTTDTEKYFPRRDVPEGSLIYYLLRRILHPPAAHLMRRDGQFVRRW